MTDFVEYVPMKQIVTFFLDENKMAITEYDRNWILAFRALNIIFRGITAEQKTIRIEVTANDTAYLPSDYMRWVKIGVLTENNQVATLRVNSSITTLNDQYPNREQYLTPNLPPNNLQISPYPYYLNYWYNNGYNVLFDAVPEGILYPGECVVDERNGIIVLGQDFQYQDIILEYTSAPQKDNDYRIEQCMQEAVIAFMAWKNKLGSELDFYARLIEGRRLLRSQTVTAQTIDQVLRTSNCYKIRV